MFVGDIHTCVGWQFVWHGTELLFGWRQALMGDFEILISVRTGVSKDVVKVIDVA